MRVTETRDPMPAPSEKALVAVKDSTAALHAFTQTLGMSRRLQFPVAALAVAPSYDGDLSLTGVGSLQSAKSEPVRTILDEALHMAMTEGLGLETYRATGLAHQAILQLIQGGGFGLVILGRDRFWTSPMNVAVRVLRHSPIDVLVIPQGWPMRFNHIVCGAIGLPGGPVLDTAMHLASLDAGRVTLFTLADAIADPGIGAFDTTQLTIEKVHDHRELYIRLRNAAQSDQTDLVVFAEAPSLGFWNALGLPAAVRLLRKSRCPLWVVKI